MKFETRKVIRVNNEYFDILDHVNIEFTKGHKNYEGVVSIIEIHPKTMHFYTGDIKGVDVKYSEITKFERIPREKECFIKMK